MVNKRGGAKILAAAAMLLLGATAPVTVTRGLQCCEPTAPPTILGSVAQACAASHCSSGVDGLDLWLSLAQVCDNEKRDVRESSLLESLGETATTMLFREPAAASLDRWSVVYSSFFCTIAVMLGTIVGYRTGSKLRWLHEVYPVV